MYDNNIGNNVMLSGDSHANWVSRVLQRLTAARSG